MATRVHFQLDPNTAALAQREWRALGESAEPWAIVIVTRLLLWFLGYVSLILVPLNKAIAAQRYLPNNLVFDGWVRWDAVNNLVTARFGYWFDPTTGQGSPLVLPMYPLLTKALGPGLGGQTTAALVIANLASIVALVLLYELVAARLGRGTARLTTLLLGVLPYSFVLAAAYPQSLALLFIAITFVLLDRELPWPAAVTASLAALTAPAALALWPALVVAQARPKIVPPGKVRMALDLPALALPPLVVGGVVLYLRHTFGFSTASLTGLVFGLHAPNLIGGQWISPGASNGTGPSDATILLAFNLLLWLGAAATIPAVARRLGLPFATFQTALLALALVADPSSSGFAVALAFPAVAIVAGWLDGALLQTAALTGSSFALALLTALFVTGHGVIGRTEAVPSAPGLSPVVGLWHARVRESLPAGSTLPHDLILSADQTLLLLGYGAPTPRYQPGQTIDVPVDVYLLKTPDQGYLVSARLLDRADHTVAHGDYVLWGKSAGLDLFDLKHSGDLTDGHYIRVPLRVSLPANLPTGAYALQLVVFRDPSFANVPLKTNTGATVDPIVLGQIAIGSSTDLGTPGIMAIPHRERATFGKSLDLLGYGVTTTDTAAGEDVQVALYWQARQKPSKNYTVSVQVLAPDGKLLAQSDSFPAEGNFPTSDLIPGEVLRDVHHVTIPKNRLTSRVEIIADVYLLATMQRLPVHVPGVSESSDHVVLARSFPITGATATSGASH